MLLETIFLHFIVLSAAINVMVAVIKYVGVKSMLISIPYQRWFAILLPLLPIIFGLALGGLTFNMGSIILNVSLGLLAGSFSSHSYSIYKGMLVKKGSE